MHCTGHTSTHDLSVTSRHALVIAYGAVPISRGPTTRAAPARRTCPRSWVSECGRAPGSGAPRTAAEAEDEDDAGGGGEERISPVRCEPQREGDGHDRGEDSDPVPAVEAP